MGVKANVLGITYMIRASVTQAMELFFAARDEFVALHSPALQAAKRSPAVVRASVSCCPPLKKLRYRPRLMSSELGCVATGTLTQYCSR